MKILRTTHAVLQKNYVFTVVSVYLFCLLSCKQNILADEHPAFTNAIIKRIDTTQNKYIDAAFYFIDSAFKALPSPGMSDIFIKDSILQSKYRFVKHDYLKAVTYLDSMLALVKSRTAEEKYAQRYTAVLYHKGEIFRSMKRYTEALYYFSLAEEAVLKFVTDKCNKGDYTGSKANLMFEQEQYLSSAAYYLQQYRYWRSACDTLSYNTLMNMEGSLNNIGLSYLRAGVLDSATWYEDAALRTIEKARQVILQAESFLMQKQ